ncbi:MAG: nucleotidyltransferase family protein [Clostridia bacterium]|nr:nucleotidyltransferase family protein [Clostridia bacterium]
MDERLIFSCSIAVVNWALDKKPIDGLMKEKLNNNVLTYVFKLLKFHGLSHLLYGFIRENQIEVSNNLNLAIEKSYLKALTESENIGFEYARIVTALNNSKIKHVTLKGEYLKAFYNKDFIRPSCDVDILVLEKGVDEAVNALKDNLEVVKAERNYHDVTINLKSGVLVELHFTLSENVKNLDAITKNYLNYIEKKSGEDYSYKFKNEFLISYLVVHTAYHFYNGGAGLKPFIDLYLLKRGLSYNEEEVLSILKNGNLTVFYKRVFDLIDVWFNGKAYNDIAIEMEKFIFNGGEYGSYYQTKSDKKGVIRKIFLPYKAMCNYYPILKKACVLYPFFIIARLFKGVFSKEKLQRAKKKIKSEKVSSFKKEKIENLFKELNL